jgi:hypothetical protein
VEKRFHTIASDFQRSALLQLAMRKAVELARDSFYHGLAVEDLTEYDQSLFAEDAWTRFSQTVSFDYPDYAHTLFLLAFQAAYRASAHDLPRGIHPDTHALANTLEIELGLQPSHH